MLTFGDAGSGTEWYNEGYARGLGASMDPSPALGAQHAPHDSPHCRPPASDWLSD
jgi:hypothetical protein